MDFIVDFPWSNSFNSILLVVDCFTKMAHFIPYNKLITDKKTTKLFLDHVFCYHGFIEDIIFLSWTPICIQVLELAFQAIRCESEFIINLPSPNRWVNGTSQSSHITIFMMSD
jgi:hypothetical protein